MIKVDKWINLIYGTWNVSNVTNVYYNMSIVPYLCKVQLQFGVAV